MLLKNLKFDQIYGKNIMKKTARSTVGDIDQLFKKKKKKIVFERENCGKETALFMV